MAGVFNVENPFEQKDKQKGGFLIDVLQTIIIALTISVVIYLFIAIPNQVDGESMEPNFHHQELLLTNKIVQWFGQSGFAKWLGTTDDYARGDIIIFNHGQNDLIKRVIAVEHDTVMIQENKLYVNGNEVDEKYIPTTTRTRVPFGQQAFMQEGETITVPEDNYFVMGDNRENSKDSRFKEIGFIPRSLVKGRVFFRYWPLDKFGIVRSGEFQDTQVTQQ